MMAKKKDSKRIFEFPLKRFSSVIAIDPGYKELGFARIRSIPEGVPPIIESEALDLDKIKSRPLRYREILRKFFHLSGGCTDYTLFMIEGYAFGFGGGGHRLVDLAGVGEMLRYVAWKKWHYWPIEVPPNTLKKYITGVGKGKKEKIILGVYKKFKKEFDTSHEAEAYALAHMGYDLICGLTKTQSLVNIEFPK